MAKGHLSFQLGLNNFIFFSSFVVIRREEIARDRGHMEANGEAMDNIVNKPLILE